MLVDRLKESCSDRVVDKEILVILDTTDVRLDNHLGRITDLAGIGILDKNQHKASYGFLVHPLYVIDEQDSTPYGIADVSIFNRPLESNPECTSEKHRKMLKKPIEEKESYRWIGPCMEAQKTTLSRAKSVTYVMDREADIWEVYKRLPEQEAKLVVRSKTNRLIVNEKGEQLRLDKQLSTQKAMGSFTLNYKNDNGDKLETIVHVKAGKCTIKSPTHKKRSTTEAMYYVEVKSAKKSPNEAPLHWILWTNREVSDVNQALEIVNIYKKRWDIEVFFKLLKSDGYDIENCQLEKGKSIRKLILILMEAALKILQLKAAREGKTKLQVHDIFEKKEISCMLALNKKLEGRTAKQKNPYPPNHLAWASWIIARLAGWKEYYSNKNPPGNKTFKDGLEKFDYLMEGYSLTH